MSRAVRLLFAAVSCIAAGAAVLFLTSSEKDLAERQAAMRAFDVRARETTDALADLRAAEQAYVAAGQGVGFWMPKVDTTLAAVASSLSMLHQSATGAASKSALDLASATLTEFGSVDRRIRDYIKADAQLMAADIVFTEGGETAAAAARHVERARLEEQQGLDRFEAARRKQQAMAAAGAAGLLILMVIALALMPAKAVRDQETLSLGPIAERQVEPAAGSAAGDLALRHEEGAPLKEETVPPAVDARRGAASALKAAAHVCTELGRVGDSQELRIVLGRAADVLDASGLVLWMATASGTELQAALTHGYDPAVAARMPSVARSANNAAAAAYRTGTLQIVLSRPGSAQGAIVAPVLSADGCIGVMSAEIRDGGEASETVQALAAIIAAQLAGVLASAPAPHEERSTGSAAL